jgi:gliding motility-associated-like protein
LLNFKVTNSYNILYVIITTVLMKIFLLTISLFLFYFYTNAQVVNGCTYLRSNFLEIGIAPNGAFGTPEDAPAGYHARPTPMSNMMFNPISNTHRQRPKAIGFVADFQKDGWDAGTPTYMGDYFMPGTIQEGFSIQINGSKSNAWSNNYQTNGSTGFTGTLTGTPTDYTVTPSSQNAIWKGRMGDLRIEQNILLRENKSYFTSTVTFINSGTDTIRKLYYMRTVDPDNEVSVTGSYSTKNKIAFKLPNSGNKTLVTARGATYNAYLGLGTKSCDAKPFYLKTGLFANENLETIYNETNVTTYGYQDSLTSDVGIGVVFKIGDIPPGDSTRIAYAYILNEADLEDAFSDIDISFNFNGNTYNYGDVIVRPTGTVVPLEITNGANYNWTWSPTTNLSTITGVSNIATVGTGPITYTVTGVSNGTVVTSCAVRVLTITISPTAYVPPPNVLSPVKYCLGATTSPLSAEATSGGVLVWYNVPIGGVPLTGIPTPSSTLTGTQTWYVSQIISGVESQRIPIIVKINPLPIVNITPTNSAVCLGDSIGLKASGALTSYTWNTASDLLLITPDSVRVFPTVPTIYSVSVVDSNSCTGTANANVQINPKPTITINPFNTAICKGDSVMLNASGGFNFSWSPSIGLNTTNGPTVIAKPIIGTVYTATAINSFGCKGSGIVNVAMHPFPILNLGNDKFICIDSVAFLDAGIQNKYLWHNGSTNQTFITNQIGTYWVRVENIEGCKTTDTFKVLGINALPKQFLPIDTILCRGNNFLINTRNFKEYLWSTNATTPSLIVNLPGLYWLQGKDNNGCVGRDSIKIIDRNCIPFNIPNAFTPNRDGVNDFFKPLITQEVTNYSFTIWNRWGNKVFGTANRNDAWDGKYKGQDSNQGAYIYNIRFIDFDGLERKYKGTIMVIR